MVGRSESDFQANLDPDGYVWRFDDRSPGGHLFDDVVHKYAMALWLLDEHVRSVQAVVRKGPLFFEAPTAALWEYERDDLLGLMEVSYAPWMLVRGHHYGADEFFEIQGTHGFLWVTRMSGEMLDLPPLVLYRSDGTTTTWADLDTRYEMSHHRSSADFIDALRRGTPARPHARDGHRDPPARLRGLRSVERAATGRPLRDRRVRVAAVVAEEPGRAHGGRGRAGGRAARGRAAGAPEVRARLWVRPAERGTDMPKYLVKANYTPEGLQGLMKDGAAKRREVANGRSKALGARPRPSTTPSGRPTSTSSVTSRTTRAWRPSA